MKKLIAFVCVVVLSTISNAKLSAQTSVCHGFHRSACILESNKDMEDDKEFTYNAQSKSGLFGQGTTSKMRCVLYKGMDYRITVCAETDVLGENIEFRIMDAKTKEELFDNTKQENAKQFEISNMATRQLIIEVTIPAGETKDKKGACVGLLIEHRVSDITGLKTY